MSYLKNLLEEIKEDNTVQLIDTLEEDLQKDVLSSITEINGCLLEHRKHKEYIDVMWDNYRKNTPLDNNREIERFSDSAIHNYVVQITKKVNDLYKMIVENFGLKYVPSVNSTNIFDLIDNHDINYQFESDFLLKQFLSKANVNNFKTITKDAAQNIADDIFYYKNFELKNSKVKLCDFIYMDSYPIGDRVLEWNTYDRKIHPLFKILSYFEYGTLNVNWRLNHYAQKVMDRKFIKDKFDLNMTKIKSIKMFKNGNFLIDFTSPAYAREFVEKFDIKN